MNELAIGIVSSLIGAAIVIIIQQIGRRIVESRGAYSGNWYGEGVNENGEVIVRDLHEIRQRGDSLNGKISRILPTEQNHRRWFFTGKLKGKEYFAIYWSTKSNIQSYGCWYMTQVGDNVFSGYQLSLQQTVGRNGRVSQRVTPELCNLHRKK